MALNKNKAGYVTVVPAGSIESDNVQDAIDELASEKAPILSPTLTGTPASTTPATSDNSTRIATTAYVRNRETNLQADIDSKAPINSPALTGAPTAPSPLTGSNNTRIATTEWVQDIKSALEATLATKAPLASPALTGNPTAPTQSAGNDSTRIATTAFVQAAVATAAPSLTALKTSGWVNGANTISQNWDNFHEIIVVSSTIQNANGDDRSHIHHTIYTDLIYPYDSTTPRVSYVALANTDTYFSISFGDSSRNQIYVAGHGDDDRLVAMYGRYPK